MLARLGTAADDAGRRPRSRLARRHGMRFAAASAPDVSFSTARSRVFPRRRRSTRMAVAGSPTARACVVARPDQRDLFPRIVAFSQASSSAARRTGNRGVSCRTAAPTTSCPRHHQRRIGGCSASAASTSPIASSRQAGNPDASRARSDGAARRRYSCSEMITRIAINTSRTTPAIFRSSLDSARRSHPCTRWRRRDRSSSRRRT